MKESDFRNDRIARGVVQGWEPVRVSGVEEAYYYYSTYNGPDITPVGFSLSTISRTSSRVTGSKYSRSLVS